MKKINFACGSLGKNKILEKVLKDSLSKVNVKTLLDYSNTLGLVRLRKQIVKMYSGNLDEDNILITSSAQQALNVILNYLVDSFDIKVFVQEPSFFGIQRILRNKKIEIVPFSSIKKIQSRIDKKKMNVIYLTSNFNNPTSKSLSAIEKKELSTLANNDNIRIIEDNPYDFLYYGKDKPKNIFEFNQENTFYVGSFSKILAPGLRIGYIITNKIDIQKTKSYKINLDIFTSSLDQQVCLLSLKNNTFLKNLREEFKKKRNFALKQLEKKFKNNKYVKWNSPKGSIFILIKLSKKFSTKNLIKIASKNGLIFEEDAFYYFNKKSRNTIRLNFIQGNRNMKNGIEKLHESFLELSNNLNLDLIRKTPEKWVQNKDIEEYTRRQATSCKYLEKLFDEILRKATSSLNHELKALFDYLNRIHQRQFEDIAKKIKIPKENNRNSFYFTNLYSSSSLNIANLPKKIDKDKLLRILSIQYVSYLRGKDRYSILKNYNSKANKRFKTIWNKFYKDATENSRKVFAFISNNFAKEKYLKSIGETFYNEDKIINEIWREIK